MTFRWPTVILGLVAFYLLFYFMGPEGSKPTSVSFDDSLPVLDKILAQWQPQMGKAFEGYRNHCYRVFHFTKAIYPAVLAGATGSGSPAAASLSPQQLESVAIAVAHHDLGIWSDPLDNGAGNVDYIDPSVRRAESWMDRHQSPKEWLQPVKLMISEHHKLTSFTGVGLSKAEATVENIALIESFRQADLVDFSLGLVRNGLSRALVSSVREHWPNAGFHAGLVELIVERLKSHPLNPAPMMKW